jgi:hypothetical protein
MPRNHSTIARPDPEALRELYIDRGLGCAEIGEMLERDASTIRHWLLQAGIPTRPRGADARQHFRCGGDPRSFAGRKHSAASKEKIRAATVASGRVPYLRDGRHWLEGAAPEHNPNWKGGATPERQEFYRTAEWRAACRAVWSRDNACCRNCRLDWRTCDRATTPTFHIHHVWSFQIRALRANPATLVLLCADCHHWVHSKANSTRAWLPQEPDGTVMPSLDDFDLIAMPSLFDTLDEEQAA